MSMGWDHVEKGSMTTPRPEYPRPHFDRSHAWLSLNGAWDFSFGEPTLDRTITVPFAWETPASGIEAHWQQTGWYRRTITVPAEWAGERVVLQSAPRTTRPSSGSTTPRWYGTAAATRRSRRTSRTR